jgi:hypothetical protein
MMNRATSRRVCLHNGGTRGRASRSTLTSCVAAAICDNADVSKGWGGASDAYWEYLLKANLYLTSMHGHSAAMLAVGPLASQL